MMSVARAGRWIAICALLAVLAGPALAVALGRLTVVEVDGGSMEPTIRFGDVVVIREPRPGDFVEGTVVTAVDSEGAKYTHRIVGITGDGQLILKGDNNEVDDPAPVPRNAVVGVVQMHFDGPAATIVTQLQSWPLRICLLVMILALVFFPVVSGQPGPSAGQPRRRRRGVQASAHGRRSTSRSRSTDVGVPRRARTVAATGSTGETLALVDSIQSAVASVLMNSDRRLTGQYTVRTKPGSSTFPRVQMLIEVQEKSSAPDDGEATDAGVSLRTVVPSVADAQSLLYARTSGSVPVDLPTRRSQRSASRHGRRRAERR